MSLSDTFTNTEVRLAQNQIVETSLWQRQYDISTRLDNVIENVVVSSYPFAYYIGYTIFLWIMYIVFFLSTLTSLDSAVFHFIKLFLDRRIILPNSGNKFNKTTKNRKLNCIVLYKNKIHVFQVISAIEFTTILNFAYGKNCQVMQ